MIEDITVSVPSGTFDGKHPRENAQLVQDVRESVEKLVANAS